MPKIIVKEYGSTNFTSDSENFLYFAGPFGILLSVRSPACRNSLLNTSL
jgi:hypothetical protein